MKVHHYSIGHIYPTGHATWRARIRLHGQRFERNFKTLPQSQGWIDDIAINHARTNRPLSPAEYYDALCAIETLPPDVTLLDAARDYALRHGSVSDTASMGILVPNAVSEFLADKRAAQLRPASLKSLEWRLRPLPRDLPVSQITPTVLDALLKDRQGANRNNYLRAWRNFFRWCQRRNYCAAIPTDAITRSRVEPAPPGILVPAQVDRLLDAALRVDAGLLAYLTIGFFAGLRTAELKRLNWGAVTTDHIHVGAKAAKTREQRYVSILPNLRAWLATCPHTDIAPINLRKRLLRLRLEAGIRSWPANAMRHSFATYHLAAYQNAPKTAHELGHRNPDTLYQHYRNLATKKDAQTYFKIHP